jgi:hypothetical protein
MKLTHSERVVLKLLDEDTDINFTTRWLVEASGLNQIQVRRAVRSLVRKGCAQLLSSWDDYEGKLCGSGYNITPAGMTEARAA